MSATADGASQMKVVNIYKRNGNSEASKNDMSGQIQI